MTTSLGHTPTLANPPAGLKSISSCWASVNGPPFPPTSLSERRTGTRRRDQTTTRRFLTMLEMFTSSCMTRLRDVLFRLTGKSLYRIRSFIDGFWVSVLACIAPSFFTLAAQYRLGRRCSPTQSGPSATGINSPAPSNRPSCSRTRLSGSTLPLTGSGRKISRRGALP